MNWHEVGCVSANQCELATTESYQLGPTWTTPAPGTALPLSSPDRPLETHNKLNQSEGGNIQQEEAMANDGAHSLSNAEHSQAQVNTSACDPAQPDSNLTLNPIHLRMAGLQHSG